MADDDHADAEQQDERGSKDRQGQEQAAALDKMTDNVRAALLLCCFAAFCARTSLAAGVPNLTSPPLNTKHHYKQVPEKQLDENRVRAAMAALAEAQRADQEAQRARCVCGFVCLCV
jgi:hypothetical protein